ncbi:MAG TPA: ATP-grasp domain-containing protein [Amycolatopsis sp.]|uniref:ATP-grasp domain-containing protein n=1 Tax=Amycolatopsis sp. TaxID=37632 RepID=UPI002B4958E8|nr:ATP-grasp domain-containing protein [Amycolatopsis sp.]HKS46136.1 ATP-grasp domain-containing protein [Amycolatopsis sp.]
MTFVNAVRPVRGEPMRPEWTVLLIGHTAETVRKAKDLGLDVILVQHRDKLEGAQAGLADVTLVADFTDESVAGPLIEAAHRIWRFSAAISLTETGLTAAGRANDLFGLGGTGHHATSLLRDKLAMREHLAANGAPAVAARALTGRADLLPFGADHGYPFVVKPVDLGAGFGIQLVRGPADAERVWATVERLRRRGRLDKGTTLYQARDFFMEEYIGGPEFSVESFSFAGRHQVIAITEKLVDPGHFCELGHAMPARLNPVDEARIVAATAEFLDLVGIRDGPAHTELRLSQRGPLIIESHNRPGGGHIPELVQRVYGVDLGAYTLGWPFGLVPEITARPAPRGAAAARAVVAGPGRISRLDGVAELAARPDVVTVAITAQVGQIVPPVHDNWDRLGMVAVEAGDADTAVKLCEEAVRDGLTVEIEPLAEAHQDTVACELAEETA